MNENSPLIYDFQESVEDVKRYREGEYHPVQLGDEFCDGRYRVVHKLGWGSYSTVWLARDQQANRNVALKIIVAIASESSSESRILRLLEQHRASGPDSTGEQSVAKLLDEFTFEGPNGRHTCLVSEPAGCSIADSQEAGDGWLFPLQIARAIATKIVLGVEFLHRVGVVHGGRSSSSQSVIQYYPWAENMFKIFIQETSSSEHPTWRDSAQTNCTSLLDHQQRNQSSASMAALSVQEYLLTQSGLCRLGKGARMSRTQT